MCCCNQCFQLVGIRIFKVGNTEAKTSKTDSLKLLTNLIIRACFHQQQRRDQEEENDSKS